MFTSLLEDGSLMDIPARSWSYITLGFGHGEEWLRQFCYRLKMAGSRSNTRTFC